MNKKQKILSAIFLASLVIVGGIGGWLIRRYTMIREESEGHLIKKAYNQQGEDVSYRLGAFLGDGGVYPQDEVVAKIGQFDIPGRVANFYIWGKASELVVGGEDSAAVDKGRAGLEKDFLAFSEAIGNELVTKEEIEELFESPGNDLFEKGMQLFEEVKLLQQSTISYELISIWFHNAVPPEIPLDEAQEIARVKMESIRNRLVSGELENMESAAEAIRNDTSLEELNPSYEGNAYIKVEDRTIESIVNNFEYAEPDIRNILESLPVGEYSYVILSSGSFSDRPSPFPQKYHVYLVSEKHLSDVYTESELIETLSNKHEISWIY